MIITRLLHSKKKKKKRNDFEKNIINLHHTILYHCIFEKHISDVKFDEFDGKKMDLKFKILISDNYYLPKYYIKNFRYILSI